MTTSVRSRRTPEEKPDCLESKNWKRMREEADFRVSIDKKKRITYRNNS